MSDITSVVRSYILEEFLPGEDPDELTLSTPLITGGILNSIAAVKLVAFLEETFHIRIEAHEIDKENIDTIDLIAKLVLRSRTLPHTSGEP
ncbi:MAG: acyl carrier protein [Acidobacteria bacterium]|nr:acyl carrier protein [Acidobacteriota bacterium]